MSDLFDCLSQKLKNEAPLAARMRPRTLDEFIGQDEIIGPGKLLRRAIEADRLFSSILLWGPPGTGKTTLAMVIANMTRSHFSTLSAVLAGKAELKVVIEQAIERRKLYGPGQSCLWMSSPLESRSAGRPVAACRKRTSH
jgi:putative ATPase